MQFDSLYTMLTHVVFCAFPPLFNGVLDKDLSSETLLKFPHIYKMGIHDTVNTALLYLLLHCELIAFVSQLFSGDRIYDAMVPAVQWILRLATVQQPLSTFYPCFIHGFSARN